MQKVNFRGESFTAVYYMEFGGTEGGKDRSNPAALESADVLDIPSNCVVRNVEVYVDEDVVGATQVDVGDDDTADGYVAAATLTAGLTVGAGAYLAAGPKWYDESTADKEVKVAVTGTASAGRLRVVVKGDYLA